MRFIGMMDKSVWQASKGVLRVILLLMAAVLHLISPQQSHGQQPKKIKIGSNDSMVAGPSASPVDKGQVRLRGIVKPLQSFAVAAQPGQMVEKIYVEPGQKVEAGQPLVKFYGDELDARVAALKERRHELALKSADGGNLDLEINFKRQAISRINKRMAALDKLAKDFPDISTKSSMQKLEEQRFVLESELLLRKYQKEKADQMALLAAKRIAQLDERIAKLEKLYQRLIVKAPFAGTVYKAADLSGMASAGGMLVELHDDSGYVVQGNIVQYHLQYVRVGSKAKVQVEFVIDQPMEGVGDICGAGHH